VRSLSGTPGVRPEGSLDAFASPVRGRRSRRRDLPGRVRDDRDLAGHLGGDVEDVALANLGTGSVRGIRGLMPDDQRAVVLLRVLGDLTVEQGSRQQRQGERPQL